MIVGVLVLVEEELEIAPRALHDSARVGQHGRHGLPSPIRGGLGRGKRVLHPALGFRPKVALLEVRIGVQERAGVRAVAGGTHLTDVEVLAEIRRRRDELPAHRHVPDGGQADHAERTGEKRTGRSGTPAQRGVPCRMAGQRDGTEDGVAGVEDGGLALGYAAGRVVQADAEHVAV